MSGSSGDNDAQKSELNDPGCYAVIFSSKRPGSDPDYEEMSRRMEELARSQVGFLGMESARGADGFGITVSYWTDEAAIGAWRRNAEHLTAQSRGRREWYSEYSIRVARVERSYGWSREPI
jgi:heme-degrading monooxygenase HmoA